MSKYGNATANGEELSVVLRYIGEGWPSHKKNCVNCANAYWNLRNSLSIVKGVIFYGRRLVIPVTIKDEV